MTERSEDVAEPTPEGCCGLKDSCPHYDPWADRCTRPPEPSASSAEPERIATCPMCRQTVGVTKSLRFSSHLFGGSLCAGRDEDARPYMLAASSAETTDAEWWAEYERLVAVLRARTKDRSAGFLVDVGAAHAELDAHVRFLLALRSSTPGAVATTAEREPDGWVNEQATHAFRDGLIPVLAIYPQPLDGTPCMSVYLGTPLQPEQRGSVRLREVARDDGPLDPLEEGWEP